MPLHVLQLGPYPPPEGGVTRNVLAIREALTEAGHDSSIIATTKGHTIRDEPNVYRPRGPFALLRLLRSLKYDILHLHIGGDITARVLALAFAVTVFGKSRRILTFHSGGYPLTPEAASATPASIRGFIFRRFSRIIAVSEAIADVFRRYGVERSRIHVVPPFTLRQPDENVAVPAELSRFLQRHSPTLLAVGGLERDYDPLFQISAMKEVLKEFPDAGLLLVGDGSMHREVEDAISASDVAEHILLAGDVEHAVTLHLIKNADVLLRTTLFDGDAISVREALHLGTPVIATNTSSRPSGVHQIEAGDTSGLVEKIRSIAEGPEVDACFTETQPDNIKAVIDIYEELAAS